MFPFFNATNMTNSSGYTAGQITVGVGPVLTQSDSVTSYILQLFYSNLIEKPILTVSWEQYNRIYTLGGYSKYEFDYTQDIYTLPLAEEMANQLGWVVKCSGFGIGNTWHSI